MNYSFLNLPPFAVGRFLKSFCLRIAVGRFLKSSCLPGLLLAAGVMAGFAGCRPFDHYGQSLQAPVSPALEPPREKSMVSLPAYRVEPPDILQIDMLKMVPLPPYRIEVYDVLEDQRGGHDT